MLRGTIRSCIPRGNLRFTDFCGLALGRRVFDLVEGRDTIGEEVSGNTMSLSTVLRGRCDGRARRSFRNIISVDFSPRRVIVIGRDTSNCFRDLSSFRRTIFVHFLGKSSFLDVTSRLSYRIASVGGTCSEYRQGVGHLLR